MQRSVSRSAAAAAVTRFEAQQLLCLRGTGVQSPCLSVDARQALVADSVMVEHKSCDFAPMTFAGANLTVLRTKFASNQCDKGGAVAILSCSSGSSDPPAPSNVTMSLWDSGVSERAR